MVSERNYEWQNCWDLVIPGIKRMRQGKIMIVLMCLAEKREKEERVTFIHGVTLQMLATGRAELAEVNMPELNLSPHMDGRKPDT